MCGFAFAKALCRLGQRSALAKDLREHGFALRGSTQKVRTEAIVEG